MAAQGIIFDLDGTVWDSRALYSAALCGSGCISQQEALESLQAGENVVGLARKLRISDEQFKTLCWETLGKLTLYAQVRETLEELQKRKTRLAVATNLPGWLIESVLQKIDLSGYFPVRIYAAAKPRPGGIRAAVQNLALNPGAPIFYVGDSASDALAASRAAIPFAWASYGYCQTKPAQVQTVLQAFSDVLNL
jgi:phosphoglycolate phosphatase